MAEAAPATPPDRTPARPGPPDELVAWARRTLAWERRLDALRARTRTRSERPLKALPRRRGLHC